MALFKLGNTHLPYRKKTACVASVRLGKKDIVVNIPMSMHIGAECTPLVKAGDSVYVGTIIGDSNAAVGAPVHSSVSGKVTGIGSILSINGRNVTTVTIESDGLFTKDPSLSPVKAESFADLSRAARNSGLVGLGGAGFPTAVKLDEKKISQIDTLLINAAECEPYITSDTRTIIENSDTLKAAIETFLTLSGVKKCVIGIEKNKPEAIKLLSEKFSGSENVLIKTLPTAYPQGGEKMLIYNCLGRIVPEGGLPADVGVTVLNVTTLTYLQKYLDTGMPLVEKTVTVDGSAVAEAKNITVPIGCRVGDVLSECGCDFENTGKIIMGGPMMGNALYTLDYPVLKNTNAILAFDKKESVKPKATPCIHCGRCVSTCPMGLNPTIYAKAVAKPIGEESYNLLLESKINLCIECGSCSYVCPAKRPLVENNRLAKANCRTYRERMESLKK